MSAIDQMDRVVSNIAPTVVAFLGTLPAMSQRMNAVYEESLDYVRALKKFRDERRDVPEPNTYPLLAFRRSVLRYSSVGAGRRLVTHRLAVPSDSDPKFDMYRMVYAELDVRFTVFTTDMADLENFEIAYLTEAGQAEGQDGGKGFSYAIPGVGDLKFFVHYQPLDDKSMVTEQNHYKAVSGGATIRGFFFVATGDTVPMITEVRLSLKDLLTQKNLDTITITP